MYTVFKSCTYENFRHDREQASIKASVLRNRGRAVHAKRGGGRRRIRANTVLSTKYLSCVLTAFVHVKRQTGLSDRFGTFSPRGSVYGEEHSPRVWYQELLVRRSGMIFNSYIYIFDVVKTPLNNKNVNNNQYPDGGGTDTSFKCATRGSSMFQHCSDWLMCKRTV